MAILSMKRIEVIALQKDAKDVIRLLQREGVVEIQTGEDSSGSFAIANGQSSLTIYEEHRNTAVLACKALEEIAGIRASMLDGFTGRTELTEEDFSKSTAANSAALHMATEINTLRVQMESAKTVLHHTRQQLERYLPWESLDIPMADQGSRHTSVFIGSLPAEYTRETLAAAIAAYRSESEGQLAAETTGVPTPEPLESDGTPSPLAVEIQIVSTTREMTCVVIVCHKSDDADCRAALRSIGFVFPTDPTNHPPSLRIGRYRARIQTSLDTIEECKAKIAAYAPRRAELLFLIDYMTMKIGRYEALQHVLFSRKTVVLGGFLPEKYVSRVKATLEKNLTLHVEFRDPKEDEDVPVLLHNNSFVAPVEDITASYSLPGPGEVDPNPVMSFFYYLFFGMMLSDAAYGILIVLAVSFLLIFRKPEGSARKNLLKFLYCGMSTILWGALFGSWFGNIVYVVSGTFFGQTVALNPIWFDPVQNPLLLLIISLILGFTHILAAMAIKFYTLWKNGHKGDAIMDVGFWWVVFAGLLMIILAIAMPSLLILQTVGMWTSIAGAAGLVVTQGRSSPSIAGKILGGVASLYSITGYFSDVLSYSRLMALGLVTGIIASVVNTIGSIGGNSVGGLILFILVFLFGHSVNIGINALGAYVHGNRLQYVEFFGKFYEGGGRPFRPFSMKMKHYKLKEEK